MQDGVTIEESPLLTTAAVTKMEAPRVGVGNVAPTVLRARAVADRLAKPIDGGSYRKTEYTFF